jgi:hypothetical protein
MPLKLPKPLDKASELPWEETYRIEPADKAWPGVSVVIPVYNCGHFLERTLRSLLCNDLTNVEIILIDGGSTDNTSQIISYYSDLFTKVVSENDRGQSDAINKGFALATKSVFHWLNGDDLFCPNALSVARKAFVDYPDAHVLVGDAYMAEADFTKPRHKRYSSSKLAFSHLLDYSSNHLIQPSVFFTSEAWKKCGPLRLDLHYAMDADLFLTMAKSCRMKTIKRDIAYSIYHPDCKTRSHRARSIAELALVQANHGGHKEAAKTLELLVAMHEKLQAETNQKRATVQQASSGNECPHCRLLRRAMREMKQHMSRQQDLLLTPKDEAAA